MRRVIPTAALALILAFVPAARPLTAQGTADLPADAAEVQTLAAAEAQAASAPFGFPIALTLGLGWGVRTDPCVACADPENLQSFSGHLGISRRILGGLGVGLDVSLWQRGHPNPLASVTVDDGAGGGTGGSGGTGTDAGAGDTAAEEYPSLVNRLANVSVTFSYRVRYLYLRAGVGPALGWSDVAEDDGNGSFIISRASGAGVGYTVGGGLTLPLAGPVGLAFYANWNGGSYDLTTTSAVLARGARHEYLEMGVGLAVR